MIVSHRSRVEHFQRCDRRGYYNHLYNNRGISRKGFDPDQLMGQCVHTGLESLLKGSSEDEAANDAIIRFCKDIEAGDLAPQMVETAGGFEAVKFNPAQRTFMVSLVEALVRGWARTRLPKIKEEFEILDVEMEEVVQLSPEVTFLTRSDFIARRRVDSSLFVFNFKTVKWPDGMWRKKFHYDQQTLSELLGPEARYGKKFGGVIIEGLVKGTKNIEYPKGSGIRYNNSPLLWAWVGPDNSPFPADLKITYDWTDSEGKPRRLGPSYTRVPASMVMPIREWVDKVEREQPLLLEGQFVTLPPVLRSDPEMESWKTSTIYREMEIQLGLSVLENNPSSLAILDQQFPKNTSDGNCLGFGETTCPFFSICWEGASPDDPDLYQPRTFNHPQEEELLK